MMRSSSERTRRDERGPRVHVRAALFMMLACSATLLVPASAPAAEPDKADKTEKTERAEKADKARCADAYKSAQVHRKNGALKRARESLLVCLSDRCPSVVQPDCTRWLTEVEAALPSVSFAAKGVDGSDVTAVRVSIDGHVVTETIDGKAIPVDPGAHSLKFEYADEPPIEQSIIMREGEKARVITVSWAKTASEEPAAPGNVERRASRGAPASAWITGALGIGALATFGVLGAHGMVRRSALEEDCFGHCRQDQVDSIKTELTAADVALGLGVVSLGVSAVLFLTSSGSSAESTGKSGSRAPSVSFGVAPLRQGGAASIGARF